MSSYDPKVSYRPLNPGEIRVVALGSDHNESQQIELIQGPLSSFENKYEALSYTWGVAPPLVGPRPAGHVFTSQNLKDALSALTPKSGQRLLWIDQACINQRDLQEKSEQVRMMDQIFSKAKLVLVWLSREIYEHRDMAQHLTAYAKVIDTYMADEYKQPQALYTYGRFNESREIMAKHAIALPAEVYHSILMFVHCVYWTRVWIIQELVKARDVNFLCGNDRLSWFVYDRLTMGLSTGVFSAEIFFDRSFMDHTINMNHLVGLRRQLNLEARWFQCNWQPMSLIQLVLIATRCKATDPRDRIYALLGLLGNEGGKTSTSIEIDYTRDFAQLSQSFFAETLVHQHDLAPLFFCTPRRASDVPSWVFDITRPTRSYLVRHVAANTYDASRPTTSCVSCTTDASCLKFKIRRLGKFTQVSGRYIHIGEDGEGRILQEEQEDEYCDIMCRKLAAHFDEWMKIAAHHDLSWTLSTDAATHDTFVINKVYLHYLLRLMLCDASMDCTRIASDKDIRELADAVLPQLIGSEQQQKINSIHFQIAIRTSGLAFCQFQLDCDQAPQIEGVASDVEPRLGWTLSGVEAGDELCIVHGFRMPMAIRKTDSGKYRFLGATFVLDFMQGEAFETDGFKDEDVVFC